MGSIITLNDTLQLTLEQGFPAELVYETHTQKPLTLLTAVTIKTFLQVEAPPSTARCALPATPALRAGSSTSGASRSRPVGRTGYAHFASAATQRHFVSTHVVHAHRDART